MGILDKLSGILGPKGGGKATEPVDEHGMYFYVRCNACGEKIRVRADKRWDLAQEYDDNDRVCGYTMDKDVLGNKCFRMMYLHVEFDRAYRITKQTVQNGTLISKEEYQAS